MSTTEGLNISKFFIPKRNIRLGFTKTINIVKKYYKFHYCVINHQFLTRIYQLYVTHNDFIVLSMH